MTQKKTVYQGRVIDVSIDHVTLPNGHALDLEVVHHPGGAAVVAVNHSGEVCLLHQYRHVADGPLWELPAGKLDADETPLKTAKRELLEEAGLTATRWQPLGRFFSSPGVFSEVIHLYLATQLQQEPRIPSPDEVFTIHSVDFDKAIEMIESGSICDAKTVMGLYLAKNHLVA